MADPQTDEQFLQRALDLARQGTALASPNPYVGAIIVDPRGGIVGSGVYTYDGVKHAEILALEQAGGQARGSTLYINLEPHAHHGRTPPCTDALIAAGIRRVVASMPDPNPKVSGLGFEQLRAAGVQVEVGGVESEARRLNEAFARYIRHGMPFVTLKAAMTLDGKIAPPPTAGLNRREEVPHEGIPRGGWITGEAARAHVQQQRHQSDAVLVGVGTILADDPLLTDRSEKPRRRPLLRVVLDSHLRLPLKSRLVQNMANDAVPKNNVLAFCSSGDDKKKHELEACGIRVEQVLPDRASGKPDIHQVLRRLGKLEIISVLVEGGAAINGAMLTSKVVDKLFLYYAPRILGGTESIPFATGRGFHQMNEAPEVSNLRVHRFGEDFAVEGYLRDPYAE